MDHRGKNIRCAVSNLLPLRAESKPLRKLVISEQPRPPDGGPSDPIEIPTDDDDDDLY
jgi:hypothetical protein